MRSSRSKTRSIAAALTVTFVAVAGVAYPFLIYLYGTHVRPALFVAGALALIALQLMVLRSQVARLWRVPLILSAVVTVAIMLLDQRLARDAFPVIRSLGAASVFAWSLLSPPSLIERFARLRQAELTPQAIRYCRLVTSLWAIWLTLNAAVAATLALVGDIEAWAIWTGGIAYAISGILFAGEFGYRTIVLERRQHP